MGCAAELLYCGIEMDPGEWWVWSCPESISLGSFLEAFPKTGTLMPIFSEDMLALDVHAGSRPGPLYSS